MEGLCPNCQYTEIPNSAPGSGVRIFSLTQACPRHASLLEKESIQALVQAQDKAKERLIREEMDRIVRAQAITNLEAQGKL